MSFSYIRHHAVALFTKLKTQLQYNEFSTKRIIYFVRGKNIIRVYLGVRISRVARAKFISTVKKVYLTGQRDYKPNEED